MRAQSILFGMLLCLASGVSGEPIAYSFTYQGELTDGGLPANGLFDFQFELYDQSSGGPIVASAVFVDDVVVNNGFFSVELEFLDEPFIGDQLWLEIGVRDGGAGGGYTGLLPRQKITATPYALHAEMVAIDAVTGAEIANGSIGINDLGPNSVGAAEIIAAQVQRRLSNACASGTYLSAVNQDGTVVCEPVTEVVTASNTSFDNTLTFVSELSSSASAALTHTVETTRSGRLQISLLANVGIGCTPTASTSRYYYITLNGQPLPSSVVTHFEGARITDRLLGITENVVAAGNHTISVGAECNGTNTPNVTSWQFASNVSVTVLPADD